MTGEECEPGKHMFLYEERPCRRHTVNDLLVLMECYDPLCLALMKQDRVQLSSGSEQPPSQLRASQAGPEQSEWKRPEKQKKQRKVETWRHNLAFCLSEKTLHPDMTDRAVPTFTLCCLVSFPFSGFQTFIPLIV